MKLRRTEMLARLVPWGLAVLQTWLVNRLEKRGLVERRPCEGDKRSRYAALTPRGEAFMDRIFPEHAEAIRLAMEGLGVTEQRITISLLRRLGMGAATRAGGE